MPTVFGNHFIFLDLRFFVLCSYIFFLIFGVLLQTIL
jgi:hypothetical protein